MIKPRFMHQSVVLQQGLKDFTLLAIGGKTAPKNWTNHCEAIDLTSFFF